jgi:hypothetical protein
MPVILLSENEKNLDNIKLRTEDLITSGSLTQNYGFTGVSIK